MKNNNLRSLYVHHSLNFEASHELDQIEFKEHKVDIWGQDTRSPFFTIYVQAFWNVGYNVINWDRIYNPGEQSQAVATQNHLYDLL